MQARSYHADWMGKTARISGDLRITDSVTRMGGVGLNSAERAPFVDGDVAAPATREVAEWRAGGISVLAGADGAEDHPKGALSCTKDIAEQISTVVIRRFLGLLPMLTSVHSYKGDTPMKSVLILASLLIVPVAYANNAKAANEGCNQSCARSYQETMVHQQELKGK